LDKQNTVPARSSILSPDTQMKRRLSLPQTETNTDMITVERSVEKSKGTQPEKINLGANHDGFFHYLKPDHYCATSRGFG
jgi:hypothetical protein